jgi:hypothetical protein
MTLLGCLAVLLTLSVVPPIDAVHLAPVTESTEKEYTSAPIRNALNLPKIVHCTEQPPGIGPSP